MGKLGRQTLRISITLVIVALAVTLGWMLWKRYMDSPWTRDGRVRADVVNVASDVAGLVTEVAVRDNQFVHRGDVLFRVDNARYHSMVAEAQARVEQARLALEMRRAQATRRSQLDDQVISRENREDAGSIAAAARAEYTAALAALDQAKLDLERTEIRSPVDGWVSNLLVRPGDYANVGAPRLAIIDQNSFWVYGYFEENKVRFLNIGDPAEIRLLGTHRVLKGHIESIARGIADRDNPTDARLLANVNPSFSWVRLAQRVPVRIRLDAIPDDLILVAGMTCTVVVHPKKED
ncbi:MAG: efflux RND transporter periplasmic adaptor subunit [Methylobacillus sp.]|jgi:p-hydroxybenzoic acid efflux pump subunit AaeA|nr:efflux RND transporter periplasmic adaptor subunit [Methylobacillus sp.]